MKVSHVKSDFSGTSAKDICGRNIGFAGGWTARNSKIERQRTFEQEKEKSITLARILNVLAVVFTIYYFMAKKAGK